MSDAEQLHEIISGYFAGGWRIAPFHKGENQYYGVKSWPQRAAQNHEELAALCAEKRGSYIFGVVPNLGMYIVDLDQKGGKDGFSNWQRHTAELFPLGDCPKPSLVVKTKSGGYHLYYANTSKTKLPSPTAILGVNSGVDIRGYSGMAVMPTVILSSEADWQPGTYAVVHGHPSAKLTTLSFTQIVPREATARQNEFELDVIRQALTSKKHPNHLKAMALGEFIIPQSMRDNTLYAAAKLCRRYELSPNDANTFMMVIASRCELDANESIEHWQRIAQEKVKRAYEGEILIHGLNDFYAELEHAGIVRCAHETGAVYFFRYGSKIFNINPYTTYTQNGLADALRGFPVSVTDKGRVIYADKALMQFFPKVQVDSYGMVPRADATFYINAEGKRCINTYQEAFDGFIPDDTLQAKARTELLPIFQALVRHIAGSEEDADYLMQKLAWIVQKPYIKPVTANVIYSHTRGVGKDSLLDLFGQLFSSHYYIKLEEGDFEQAFSIYHEKIIAVFSEVQIAPGSQTRRDIQKLVGRIKQMITNRELSVNEKFKPMRKTESYTNYFILSNYKLSAIMEPGERRIDVFHATEEKIDQRKFGTLLDISNKQNWQDPDKCDERTQLYWRNVLYCIREYLQQLHIEYDFRRQEARVNAAKHDLMENFAGEATNWLRANLPPFFTREMVQWLATMCPFKLDAQYAMNNLQDAFGMELKPVIQPKSGTLKLAAAPMLTTANDNGKKQVVLRTGSAQYKSVVYSFSPDLTAADGMPLEHFVRKHIERWVRERSSEFYGPVQPLPKSGPSNVLD